LTFVCGPVRQAGWRCRRSSSRRATSTTTWPRWRPEGAAIKRYPLIVTEDGHAKRVPVSDVPSTKRAPGVRVSFEALAGAVVVTVADELVVATRGGKVERLAAAEAPVKGRRARGVRVMRLAPGDTVARVAVVPRTPPQLHPGDASRPAGRDAMAGGRGSAFRGRNLTAGQRAVTAAIRPVQPTTRRRPLVEAHWPLRPNGIVPVKVRPRGVST